MRLPVKEVDLVLLEADKPLGVHFCFEISGGHCFEDELLDLQVDDLLHAHA